MSLLPNTIFQVKPKQDFLNLLRDVGALGTQTSHGEVFTVKDVSSIKET